MSLDLTRKIVFSLTLNGKQLSILQNITVYMRIPFRCAILYTSNLILYTSNLTQRKDDRIYTLGSADYNWELCVHDHSQFMFGSGTPTPKTLKPKTKTPKSVSESLRVWDLG